MSRLSGGAMLESISKAIEDDVEKLDSIYLQTGDALDAKASFVLVIITLSAAFSGQILILKDLPSTIKVIQVLAVAAMVLGVAFSIAALWPADFKIPPKPEDWENFVITFEAEKEAELKTEHKELSNADVLQAFKASRRRVAANRIGANKEILERKSKFNNRAFYSTAATIAAQAATLVWLELSRL
jgi:hypothetical protein